MAVSSDATGPPEHPVRFVTAASLFDGHDAAINIMRRILQRQGAEVIHLGHNRSVDEVVTAAVQEDVQGVAVSSYQGGHVEYFTYLVELLPSAAPGTCKVYGGGGGVIVPAEIELLHARGVARIFSPEDGQRLGLPGMVNTMVAECDVDLGRAPPVLRRPLRRRARRRGPRDHRSAEPGAPAGELGPRRRGHTSRCWASRARAARASRR